MSDCCPPDANHHGDTAQAAEGVTTVYAVTGMTCEHCVKAVTEEVSALEPVRAVRVDLEAGTVAVTTGAEPDDAAVAAAVDEAGYELTGRAV